MFGNYIFGRFLFIFVDINDSKIDFDHDKSFARICKIRKTVLVSSGPSSILSPHQTGNLKKNKKKTECPHSNIVEF